MTIYLWSSCLKNHRKEKKKKEMPEAYLKSIHDLLGLNECTLPIHAHTQGAGRPFKQSCF